MPEQAYVTSSHPAIRARREERARQLANANKDQVERARDGLRNTMANLIYFHQTTGEEAFLTHLASFEVIYETLNGLNMRSSNATEQVSSLLKRLREAQEELVLTMQTKGHLQAGERLSKAVSPPPSKSGASVIPFTGDFS